MNDCCNRPGQEGFDVAVIGAGSAGFSAAIAAAKSPPDAAPNASGKLFGPSTRTGPMGSSAERRPAAVSIVGSAQSPARAAAAACVGCLRIAWRFDSMIPAQKAKSVFWTLFSFRN